MTLPVKVLYISDKDIEAQSDMSATRLEGGVFQQFINSYQVMFFTFFALLTGTAVMVIAYHAFFSPRDQFHHPAFARVSSPQLAGFTPSPTHFNASPAHFNASPSSSSRSSPRTRLWTDHPSYWSQGESSWHEESFVYYGTGTFVDHLSKLWYLVLLPISNMYSSLPQFDHLLVYGCQRPVCAAVSA